MDPTQIDWSDITAHISAHFCVGEATLLPSWGVHHIPSEQEKSDIVAFAARLDMVRDMLGRPLFIHCWIRPTSTNCQGSPYHGQNYNAHVGGAPKSGHILGRAADWDAGEKTGAACDALRAHLEPSLDSLGLRMENKPGPWVHLDSMPVTLRRFFIP